MSRLQQNLQQLYNVPPSPLQELQSDVLDKHKLRLFIKRDDLLHPEIGGNKWRKLKYNLAEALNRQAENIATFGGAYSNHIAAVAAAGGILGIRTTGFIRGEEHLPLNPTLQKAVADGMKLVYIDRETYRRKTEPEVLKKLVKPPGEMVYLLPEGGSNALAVKGCAEVITELNMPWDYVCCPVGSGGSMAGLIAGSAGMGTILGFPALKGGHFLMREIEDLQEAFSGQLHGNWQLQTDYHFGGYAKVKPELLQFIRNFALKFDIQLDPIYTGKMMFGIFDLIEKSFFPERSTIIAWHTGGLQGIEGMRRHGIEV